MNRRVDLNQFLNDYQQAIFRGDAQQASEAIGRAMAVQVPASEIYLQIIAPAQVAVGEAWLSRQISVAQEHVATEISLSEMARLRHATRPKFRLGLRAVVASVDGDGHWIGSRIVADFLQMEGWEVEFVGTNTPQQDFVDLVKTKSPDLVGLGITLAECGASLAELCSRVKSEVPQAQILVGGRGIAAGLAPGDLGADARATDARDAVHKARELCPRSGVDGALHYYLKELGARLLEQRKARGLSQQEVADRAGLDRTYLSSVENGKQNVSVAVLFRLADALGSPVDDLLLGRLYGRGASAES